MYCKKCGMKLHSGEMRCKNCGTENIKDEYCGGFWDLVHQDTVMSNDKNLPSQSKNHESYEKKKSGIGLGGIVLLACCIILFIISVFQTSRVIGLSKSIGEFETVYHVLYDEHLQLEQVCEEMKEELDLLGEKQNRLNTELDKIANSNEEDDQDVLPEQSSDAREITEDEGEYYE